MMRAALCVVWVLVIVSQYRDFRVTMLALFGFPFALSAVITIVVLIVGVVIIWWSFASPLGGRKCRK